LRRLIINADDFGLTSGVNRAIVEAHQQGVVTSATLMANSRAFDEAAAMAKRNPTLAVGCHVVLVDGFPVSAPSNIPSLLGQDSARFRAKLGQFVRAGRKVTSADIEAEATAQIRKIQAAGVTVSHLDSHKHTHMFPAVTGSTLRAAKACGVATIRNPFERARFRFFKDRRNLWTRYVQVRMLHLLARRFRRQVHDAGLHTTHGTIGIVATGSLDHDLFECLVRDLPDGTWEFVCHPGYNDAELQNAGTRLLESRAQELEILTSPRSRDLLKRCGIELISYRDLA
jgi:hopanoid biosynthesis associated protein HpnK